MKLAVVGTKDRMTVSRSVFQYPFKESLVHQVLVAYAANGRKGTRAQRSRSGVSGSNRKPWRQKGTGRARCGTRKSPLWRSGGVTFAAKPQQHKQKINKKMYRGAVKSIFSELIRENRLVVLNELSVEKPKTKIIVDKFRTLKIKNAVVIVHCWDRNLSLASRNLPRIFVTHVHRINPLCLIKFSHTVVTSNAMMLIEKMLS